MPYCDKCRVEVPGDRRRCPLCQGQLPPGGDPQAEVFPVVPTVYRQHHLVIRIFIFLSIAAGVICVACNFLFTPHRWWSVLVLAGIGCMWVSVSSAVRRRHNLPKNILRQLFWLSMISLLWDFLTRWRGWSVTYAIPGFCVIAMLCLLLLARILHMKSEDFLVYMILDGLFGIIPLAFILFGWAKVSYPSVICIVASVLSFTALFSFAGRKTQAELQKRLHM